MGLTTGLMNFTVFEVKNEKPIQDFKKFIVDTLNEFRFSEKNRVSSKELVAGFTTIMNPLDFSFNHDKVFFTNFLAFSYREDSKKIPSQTFKIYLEEEIEKYKKELNKTRVNKQEKDSLREDLYNRLIEQAIPDIKIFDILWFYEKNELFLFSTSKTVIKHFLKIFKLAFNLELRQKNMVDFIENLNLEEGYLSKLYSLKPFDRFEGVDNFEQGIQVIEEVDETQDFSAHEEPEKTDSSDSTEQKNNEEME